MQGIKHYSNLSLLFPHNVSQSRPTQDTKIKTCKALPSKIIIHARNEAKAYLIPPTPNLVPPSLHRDRSAARVEHARTLPQYHNLVNNVTSKGPIYLSPGIKNTIFQVRIHTICQLLNIDKSYSDIFATENITIHFKCFQRQLQVGVRRLLTRLFDPYE